ncbi:hypothetical protein RTCIAT899_PC00610 (plasmid) [Rhizobium tropici CIAT 899]|nr:hypothetical protein RTCIAT899_PC00610 [Rhizobium tropici CIAT 899]
MNTAADSILFGGAREWINGSFGLLSMEMRGQIGKWASEDARAVSRHWQFSGQTIRSADGRRQ